MNTEEKKLGIACGNGEVRDENKIMCKNTEHYYYKSLAARKNIYNKSVDIQSQMKVLLSWQRYYSQATCQINC